ncbi:hypothetical protein [Rhizobium mongolense]|uniref:Uncharacterized protein n=1 Tax=Rhizobium mongolense TaxID=57676 RepID=A0A7W6RQ73_9HYPH|nr:hypothetical protein [Rhizobium mongolense]MBB4276046.1 hypothetical protein [Rhizobium mongolense]
MRIDPVPSLKAGPDSLDELSTSPLSPTATQDTTVATGNDGAEVIVPIALEVKSAKVVSASTSYGWI